jgi:hypothetical protein
MIFMAGYYVAWEEKKGILGLNGCAQSLRVDVSIQSVCLEERACTMTKLVKPPFGPS